MKKIIKIVIHPHIGNDSRAEVISWCNNQYGDLHDQDEYRWTTTSNYERSKDGTFDVVFYNEKDAHWFLLRWGGEIVEIDAEYVYGVSDEQFNTLFVYEK